MKIFIGTEEIASLLSGLAFGFRSLGHQVTTYTSAKNKFYNTHQYDIVRGTLVNDLIHYWDWKFLPKRLKDYSKRIDTFISIPYLKWKNRKLIEENDVFIFIWRPWLHESYLFPLLKKKGKKIICIHVGTDVRHVSAFEQQYGIDTSGWGDFFTKEKPDPKIRKIRYHELYADIIYSVPDQAGLYLRSYNHLRLALNKSKNIVYNIPARKVPLIVHAPSRSAIKGTEIINATIERLKKEGIELEYKLIENLPNEQLLKLLSEADILCDELNLHGPGVLSAEAMAAGCAVATRCLNMPPFQPPVCAVTPDNLYESLKRLITDITYRTELAADGKKFADNFNDPVNIAGKMLEDLERKTTADYEAGFFMQHYQLPAATGLTAKAKQLTQQVIKKLNLQSKADEYGLAKRGLV
ncbi:MAG: hypothetical protein JNM14_04790 [Ferruginibacter sp.]|nr:hypothetical protein [Ferruginibacter sp.]